MSGYQVQYHKRDVLAWTEHNINLNHFDDMPAPIAKPIEEPAAATVIVSRAELHKILDELDGHMVRSRPTLSFVMKAAKAAAL